MVVPPARTELTFVPISLKPSVRLHVPAEHEKPLHPWPQVPQLFGSVARSGVTVNFCVVTRPTVSVIVVVSVKGALWQTLGAVHVIWLCPVVFVGVPSGPPLADQADVRE